MLWEEFFIKRKIIIIVLVSFFLYFSFFLPVGGRKFSNVSFYSLIIHRFDVPDEFEKALFVLSIPRIKLKRNVYNINSSLNYVDFNVEILRESDVSKKIFYLAAHSGSGNASYFNDLRYLEIGDFVYLDFPNERFVYVVEDIYSILKTGKMDIYEEDCTLYLITCSLEYSDRQLVIKARLF